MQSEELEQRIEFLERKLEKVRSLHFPENGEGTPCVACKGFPDKSGFELNIIPCMTIRYLDEES